MVSIRGSDVHLSPDPVLEYFVELAIEARQGTGKRDQDDHGLRAAGPLVPSAYVRGARAGRRSESQSALAGKLRVRLHAGRIVSFTRRLLPGVESRARTPGRHADGNVVSGKLCGKLSRGLS